MPYEYDLFKNKIEMQLSSSDLIINERHIEHNNDYFEISILEIQRQVEEEMFIDESSAEIISEKKQ